MTDAVETWRVVPSLPEYLASSLGRVMRVPHVVEIVRGARRQYGGQPTFGTWRKSEDRYAIMFRRKNYKVARLICEAFVGPPPFAGAVCMHLDENSRNNAASNLAWGTQAENLNAPGFLAYCRSRVGEDSPTRKHAA